MFSVVTKYHKGRHSLFLCNSEIFYAFTQDILRSPSECHDDTLQFILEKQREFNHKEIFYKQLQKTTATMVDSLEHSQSDLEDLINKLGDINN
ncbi:hypothetical protein CCLMGIMDO_CCLMGIMDO_01366 [Companilactobacillus crustorum]